MIVYAIFIALCVSVNTKPQLASFEKQAMSLVQNMLASNLDVQLPKRPFANWFNQLIGPSAGVVWQLTECGDRNNAENGMEKDLAACTEANAVLPDGRKVVVLISVGTFKKGLNGKPAFFSAVVERNDQLYQARKLSDLPEMMRKPERNERRPPDITALLRPVKLLPYAVYSWLPALNFKPAGSSFDEVKAPSPPPSSPPKPLNPQKVLEGVLQGNAITRAKPVYPASARSMNAYGKVEVKIIISEEGRVIEAKAISGHPALHNAAVEAAYKWVYKPTTLNGVAVKVESILTFNFAPGAQ